MNVSSFINSTSFEDTTTTLNIFNITVESLKGKRDNTLALIEVGVQGIIFALTLIGNLVVLALVLSLSRKRRKEQLGRMYTMIGHLSIADLSVATLNQLPQLAWDITFRFRGGPWLCKMVTFGQVLAMYASSYVLVSTALDRYMAICHPMKSHSWTAATAHKLVGIAWLISALFSMPQLFIFSLQRIQPNSEEFECLATFDKPWTLTAYTTWFTAAVYIVPLILLSFIYIRICLVVWKNVAAAAVITGDATNQNATLTSSGMTTGETNSQRSRNEQKKSFNSKFNQKSSIYSDENPNFVEQVEIATAASIAVASSHLRSNQCEQNSYLPPANASSPKPPHQRPRNKLVKMNSLTSISEISSSDMKDEMNIQLPHHYEHSVPKSKRYSLTYDFINSFQSSQMNETDSIYAEKQNNQMKNRRKSFMSFMSIKRLPARRQTYMDIRNCNDFKIDRTKYVERQHNGIAPFCKIEELQTSAAVFSLQNETLKFDSKTNDNDAEDMSAFPTSDAPEVIEDPDSFFTNTCSADRIDFEKKNKINNDCLQSKGKHNQNRNRKTSALRLDSNTYIQEVSEDQSEDLVNTNYEHAEIPVMTSADESEKLKIAESFDKEIVDRTDSQRQSLFQNPQPNIDQNRSSQYHSAGHGISRAKARTAKLTMAVVIGYLVCWGPFFVSQLWWAWDTDAPYEDPFMVITLLLASLNSCINPWIYLAFSDQLRRRATRICCGHRKVAAFKRANRPWPTDREELASGVWRRGGSKRRNRRLRNDSRDLTLTSRFRAPGFESLRSRHTTSVIRDATTAVTAAVAGGFRADDLKHAS